MNVVLYRTLLAGRLSPAVFGQTARAAACRTGIRGENSAGTHIV
ncbi:MAG TPA: hypothetical protein VF509_02505 [Sphingobium sp.]